MNRLLHLQTRQQKVGIRVFFLYILILVYSLNVIPILGATNELIGQYEITAYIDGPFSGTTAISQTSSDTSLTTSFGTFSIEYVTHYSDFRMSHSSQGYVSVSNWNYYIANGGDLVKSESTWSLHISGYQEDTVTMTYEYGNYQTLSDTESIYEESYTQRYYEDGSLQESVECRDVMELETVESKITRAGTFECARIKTAYYENELYVGYSLIWITEDGTLVENQAYDENGSISMKMSLISESEPAPFPFEVLLLVVPVIGAIVIVFYIYRRRTSTTIPSYQSMTRLGNSYTKTCPSCGSLVSPFHKFCERCGEKLES